MTVLTTPEQEAQEELENIRAQGANSAKHVEELQQSCKPYVERKEQIKGLLVQRDLIRKSQQEVIEGLTLTQTRKRHEVSEWTKKKEAHSATLQQLGEQVEAWAERMQEAMDKASEMCPRDQVEFQGKGVKRLESNIASLERALRAQEERLGGSSEEVYKRFVQAKKTYDENHKIIQDLKDCCTVRRMTLSDLVGKQCC